MSDFDLAPDGKRAAFSSLNEQGSSRVWIAALDHRTPPQQVTSIESDNPSFGPSDTLFFRGREGDSDIVYGVELSDTKPRRISANPVPGFYVVSPDGKWLLMRHPVQSAQPVREAPKFASAISARWVGGRMASTSTSSSHLGDGHGRTLARILQVVLSRIAPVPNDNRPPQAPRVERQLSRNVPSVRLCEVSVGLRSHRLITPRNSSDFAWCCAISIVLWKQDCASTVLSCILKNSPCRRKSSGS
jgi:hypothetical protein